MPKGLIRPMTLAEFQKLTSYELEDEDAQARIEAALCEREVLLALSGPWRVTPYQLSNMFTALGYRLHFSAEPLEGT